MLGSNRNNTPPEDCCGTPPFAVPDFDKYSKKPLSRRAKRLISALALTAIAGVCVILAVVFNLKGILIKHFGSDRSYFEYVYEKGSEELAEDFSNLYGMGLAALQKGQCATSGIVELETGQDLNSLITLASRFVDLDEDLSLEGLENASIAYTADINKEGALLDAEVRISDTSIATVEFRRAAGGKTVLRIPEMGEGWLELSEPSEAAVVNSFLFDGVNISAALPDKQTAERLMLKYFEALIGCVDEVRGEDITLSCDSVSAETTRLVVELDEDKLDTLAEKLFDDVEVVKIGKNVYQALTKSESGFEENWERLEELFYRAVEEIRGADADIALYVNSKHKFCGIKLNFLGHEFSMISLKQGKATAHSVALKSDEAGELFEISGVGEETNKYNADYRLKLAGKNALRIKFQDAERDLSGGKIKISPDSSLVEAFGLEGLSRLVGSLFKALSFEGSYSIKDGRASFDLDVKNSGTKFFSFRINSQEKEEERISFPDSAFVTQDVKKWRHSLSSNNVIETLRGLGLSEGLMELAEDFIDSIGKY